jgi:hypothetical protein
LRNARTVLQSDNGPGHFGGLVRTVCLGSQLGVSIQVKVKTYGFVEGQVVILTVERLDIL